MKFVDYVPPVALTAVRRLRSGSGRKQYASHAEAVADCAARADATADSAGVVVAKTQRYRDELLRARHSAPITATNAYSLCALLAVLDQEVVHVLDFGGAAGAHYFLTRAILPFSRGLNWTVVETPEMVERARPVLSSDELSFSSNVLKAASRLGRIDLLHTSGTLQCVGNPHDALQTLLSVSPQFILFNRLGLTTGDHDVITVHEAWLSWNGPGPMPSGIADRKIRSPFVFPRESVFMEQLGKNYEIVMTFEDASGAFPVGQEPIKGLGLLAKRKA